jgi:hypothetical protein
MVMKLSLIAGFSILLVSAIAAPAKAEPNTPTAVNPYVAGSDVVRQITPAELATLANRGYLEAQGIPSYSILSVKFELGQVTARDIVEAGVKSNRIAATALDDPGYINAVDSHLRSLYIVR